MQTATCAKTQANLGLSVLLRKKGVAKTSRTRRWKLFMTDCLVARSRFAKKPHRRHGFGKPLSEEQKSATWPIVWV
jgi:hypothetical protein